MPQHAKRFKIRRKDLRKPDEFETLTGEALDWAGQHRSLLVGAVVVVLTLGLAGLAFSRWRTSQNEAAALRFGSAHEVFDGGRFGEAAEAFAALARDYPRTPSGRLAPLYRAHAIARQGDASAAATAYGEFLAASGRPGYLTQEALTGLGRAKEASGDSEGALEAYTRAGALEGPFRTDALLSAARLHEAAGHADQARDIYAGLLKDASEPDLRALLRSKLGAAGQ